jgi:transposase
MGWGAAVRIELKDAERSELQARARRRKIARADAMRAEIVLLAADGMTNLAIAERLGITRVTVAMWRRRFAAKRLDGLVDEPRPGAPRKIGDEKIAEVVTTTLETMPATATHWSTRSMARATGVSISTVHRIWRAFSLQPHRSETFKLSTDPLFVGRSATSLAFTSTRRIVRWCSSMRNRNQAWIVPSRLPMRRGRPSDAPMIQRMGRPRCLPWMKAEPSTCTRHRAQESPVLDPRTTPADLDIVIMDNA